METSRDRKGWLRKIRNLRRTRMWEDTNKILAFFSTINGYHHFRTMPEEFDETNNYVMECIPEPRNRIDPMAVLVKKMGTDITIGRMPKDICNVVSVEKRISRKLIRAYCLYVGTYHNEGPVQGGGMKLHCVYVMEFTNETTYTRLEQIVNHLMGRNIPQNHIYL